MSKLAYISIILLYSFSALLTNVLQNVGIEITGLDYILFYILMILLLSKKKHKYNKVYFILSLTISLFCFIPYFTSSYIISFFWFFVGYFLLIMQIVSFNVFYRVSLNEKTIISLLRNIQLVNLIIIIVPLIKFALNFGAELFTDMIITKEAGITATLINFNIIITLTLSKIDKKKRDVFFIIISAISIFLSVLLKSLFSMLLIFIIFSAIFSRKKMAAQYFKFLVIIVVFFGIIISNPKISRKLDFYYGYYFVEVVESNPRYAAFNAAFNIAKDHFPFGSGPSTFGSFPVKVVYNDTYRDYKLDDIYGLSINSSPNFLLDTYWSSPIAELGFIGFILFFVQFMYPLFLIFKFRKINSSYYKPFFFYILASSLVIGVESMALSIYSQITFIILHNGISPILINYLKYEKANKTTSYLTDQTHTYESITN